MTLAVLEGKMTARERQVLRAKMAPCVTCGADSPLGAHTCDVITDRRRRPFVMDSVMGQGGRPAPDDSFDYLSQILKRQAEASRSVGQTAKDASKAMQGLSKAIKGATAQVVEARVVEDEGDPLIYGDKVWVGVDVGGKRQAVAVTDFKLTAELTAEPYGASYEYQMRAYQNILGLGRGSIGVISGLTP